MRILPAAKSRSWLLWMIVYGVVLSLLLWANRFVVLEEPFEGVFAFRFAVMAFVISFVANGFGWLGARWIWLLTTLGVAGGLILMFVNSSRDMSGWEDLSSLLGFFAGVVIGFIAGLAAEG